MIPLSFSSRLLSLLEVAVLWVYLLFVLFFFFEKEKKRKEKKRKEKKRKEKKRKEKKRKENVGVFLKLLDSLQSRIGGWIWALGFHKKLE
jgi:hypothetical protein